MIPSFHGISSFPGAQAKHAVADFVRYTAKQTTRLRAEPVLIAAKIISTFITVILLAAVAERLSPRHAGLLSGFPLGTAIALFFFGWQQGADFAAQSAVYTLAGLAGAMCLAWGYLKLVNFRPDIRWIGIAIITGLGCFLTASWLLQWLPDNRWINLLFVVLAIILFRKIFKSIPEYKIQPVSNKNNKQKSLTLLFRATIATLSILLITGLAELLGPTRSGLLAAFPISFFPLMLILHISYGKQALAATIKHYPDGLGALVVYCFSVSYIYPVLGIGWGTVTCLALSCIYLMGYGWVRSLGSIKS